MKFSRRWKSGDVIHKRLIGAVNLMKLTYCVFIFIPSYPILVARLIADLQKSVELDLTVILKF